jgi:hypothetical protein
MKPCHSLEEVVSYARFDDCDESFDALARDEQKKESCVITRPKGRKMLQEMFLWLQKSASSVTTVGGRKRESELNAGSARGVEIIKADFMTPLTNIAFSQDFRHFFFLVERVSHI